MKTSHQTARWMKPVTAARQLRSKTKSRGLSEDSADRPDFTVKGIFHHDHHIMEVQEVTHREKSLNPEMLTNGRKKELEGWHSFNVVSVVPVEEMMINNRSPLSTRWVDVWKVGSNGTKTMKNRLVIKGYVEDTSKLHTYSPTIGREVVILCLNVILRWDTGDTC